MEMWDGFSADLSRAIDRFRTNPKSAAKFARDPTYRRDDDPDTKKDMAALCRTFNGDTAVS